MYKKFLNAILFGALILGSAGTITSCKDYDDEIDEINQKLNTMTQKDELNAQVASLTSAISAAQAGAAQAATEAANALAAAKEAAGVSDQALAAAAQAGGQSGEALTAAKNAAAAAETAAANTKKAADAAAAAAADAVKAAQAGTGSAAAADKAAEAAGKAQTAASEAAKTANDAQAAATTAAAQAKTATEKADAAANQAGVSAKEAADAKTAAAAAQAKAAEAAAQAAVAKEAEAAAQAAAADALKAAADAADAAKKAADAETLAKAANEASAKANIAAGEAKTAADAAKTAAADANKLADSALTAANKAQGTADEAKKTAEAAQALAEAAKTVADAAAKKSALTELEGRVDGIEERLQKIEDNVDSLDLKTIADMIQKASDDLKVLDLIATAVTSVSIVDSYTAAQVLSSDYIQIKAEQGTWANFYYELLAAKLLMDGELFPPYDDQEEEEFTGDDWTPFSINRNPLDLDFTTIVEYGDWTAAQNWGKWFDEYENEKPFDFYGIGADLKNAMAFKKGTQVNRPDYFVVRVSPTNAVITGDMLQLVNSDGVNLNEFLTLEVDKFEGTLSRIAGVVYPEAKTRADEASETGLWIVKATLKSPYDTEKFAELTEYLSDLYKPKNPNQGSMQPRKAVTRSTVNLDDDSPKPQDGEAYAQLINKILYAVQVNNTEEGGDRYVTSSYDLTFGTSVFQPANRLHFSVNGTRVEKLTNRFEEEAVSFLEGSSKEQEYGERVWLPDTVDVKPGIRLTATKDAKRNADINANVYDNINYIKHVGYANNDNRAKYDDEWNDVTLMTVAPGEEFTVTLDEYQGWATLAEEGENEDGTSTFSTNVIGVPTEYAVKAVYVVLDQPNAVESVPSEWNAWVGYRYTGINEIFEVKDGKLPEIKISVRNGDNPDSDLVSKRGDIIGFRVYAINWDGTLVDPDGRAFYVKVANEAEVGDATNTVIYPTSDKDFKEYNEDGDYWMYIDPTEYPESEAEEFAFDAKTLKRAKAFRWTSDIIKYTDWLSLETDDAQHYDRPETPNQTMSFYPIFQDAKGNVLFDGCYFVWDWTEPIEGELSSADLANLAKVTQVVTVPTIPNWLAYVDDKAYNGKLEILDQYGDVLETIVISMTKVIPTTAPKGYEAKTGQIINGVLQLYVEPDDWTAGAATVGTMPMTDVFNFGSKEDVRLYPENYNITFAASAKDDQGNLIPVKVRGDQTLEIDKAFVDSKTPHATKVDYNYGFISTKLYDKKSDTYAPYVVKVDEFQTIYDCIYHGVGYMDEKENYIDKPTYSWNWITLDEYKAIEVEEEVLDADGNPTGETKVTKPNAKATQADLDAITKNIQYGVDGEQTVNLEYVLGVSKKDKRYNAPLNESYEGSLDIKDAHLISNANQAEEYFKAETDGTTVTFTQLSDAPNPNIDVPSTLVINCIDSYGHKVAVTVPMVVLKR